jgi:LacI family transcriptional regulator
MAFGVCEAARRRGLCVPDDLSMVGFDDLREESGISPRLTTVCQPLAEMGLVAARTLLRLAQGEEIETLRIELATAFVARASTASTESVDPKG